MAQSQTTTIRVTEHFGTNPDGREDGAKFRRAIEPAVSAAFSNGRGVTVDLNGFDYGTAFLEEAFGGLTRGDGRPAADEILSHLTIDHELRPYVLAAEHYVRNPDSAEPPART